MIRDIVLYGHPALRAKGIRIACVDDSVRQLAVDMLETMEDAAGVGLAAQQVGVPLQLTVVDISCVEDRPSRMWVDGREVDPLGHMPLILLNPQLEPGGEKESGQEGCLSFPEITAEIVRPSRAKVDAVDLEGHPVVFECDGLLARALQHEVDHLHGVLFIDRMNSATRAGLTGRLKRLKRDNS
jgi:peptide deformylase